MANLSRLRAFAGAGALLAGFVGCSGVAEGPQHAADQEAADQGPADQGAVARADLTPFADQWAGIEAVFFESPAVMAAEYSISAAGEITGFADGFEVLERGSQQEGYDIRDYTVVIQVRVSDLYKGSEDDLDESGFIYLSFPRGAAQEGVNDDGGPSTITPVEDFERAIPVGTEVVVIASPVTLAEGPGTEVIDGQRSVPDGSPLFSVMHPQALVFAAPNGATTAWRKWSLDEVRQDLKAES